MNKKNNILLAFYGDDFTGSTDALEFLTRAGAKTMLFIEPPSKAVLAKYPGLNAFGVAGRTRSMSPAEMKKTLLPAFEKLKQCGARHVHYKICSTFDSSPKIGSIGKAIDAGAEVFKNKFTPLLVAAPLLGRYCLFGNLFARMGIGSEGSIHR
ncbi:MAG: four-carbon acid sugar kinase family protein, partial [Chitinophagaceae bacterium]